MIIDEMRKEWLIQIVKLTIDKVSSIVFEKLFDYNLTNFEKAKNIDDIELLLKEGSNNFLESLSRYDLQKYLTKLVRNQG